jgi:hypothetical protein
MHKRRVCIHPQITFHNAREEGPLDLSIEVTLIMKNMINNGYLRMNKHYKTSIENLDHMLYYPLSKLNLYVSEKDDNLFILWPKTKSKEELNKYIEAITNNKKIVIIR